MGFFYVKNHGISKDVIDGAFEASKTFFSLSLSDRMKVVKDKFHRGYLPIGTTRYPGKAADFIVLDLNSIHAVPMFDAITHLVYSTSKSDVCDVFVDGKQVVHDGKAIKVNMDQTLENVRALAPSIRASLE